MNDNLVLYFILCLFLVIMFASMYLSAFITGIKMKKFIKVKGRVTFTRDTTVDSGDSSSPVTYYYCEYEYEGNKYEIRNNMSVEPLKYGEGIDIYINPKKTNKFLNPSFVNNREHIMALAQLGWIPFAFILLMLFFLRHINVFFLCKKKEIGY